MKWQPLLIKNDQHSPKESFATLVRKMNPFKALPVLSPREEMVSYIDRVLPKHWILSEYPDKFYLCLDITGRGLTFDEYKQTDEFKRLYEYGLEFILEPGFKPKLICLSEFRLGEAVAVITQPNRK